MNQLLSIIIPVYNVEKHIVKCLESVIVNVRPILFLMTLLLTKPFEWLIKMRLYRRYFDKFCMVFWIPSMMRDYLSIQHKSEN